MNASEFLVDLAALPAGHTHHGAALEFSVVDDAEQAQALRVDVTCDIEAMDKRFFVRGDVVGEAQSVCHRCLRVFGRPVGVSFNVVFEFGDPAGDGSETVFMAESEPEIDLAVQVREAIVLEEPISIVCQNDCKGLCAHCGQNRNEEICACTAPVDSRWDALKALSAKLDQSETK